MKNTLLTLQEAADMLHLKDVRSVLKWGRQGRFILIGSRKHVLVNAASLQAYAEGKSAWHEKQQQQSRPDANQTPARSAKGAAGRNRGKRRSQSDTENTATIHFFPDRKLKNT